MAQAISLTKTVQPIIKALRHNDRVALHAQLPVITPVLRTLTERMDRKNGAKHRRERGQLRAITQMLTDVKNGVLGGDMLPDELVTAGKMLKAAVSEYTALNVAEDNRAPLDAAQMFAQGERLAAEDRGTLRRQATKSNPHPHLKLTRTLLIKAVPFYTDDEIARTTHGALRVVEGFTLLPKCRLLAWSSSPLGVENETWADHLLKSAKVAHGRAPNICTTGGVHYAWVSPYPDADALFSERRIDAWCPAGV